MHRYSRALGLCLPVQNAVCFYSFILFSILRTISAPCFTFLCPIVVLGSESMFIPTHYNRNFAFTLNGSRDTPFIVKHAENLDKNACEVATFAVASQTCLTNRWSRTLKGWEEAD